MFHCRDHINKFWTNLVQYDKHDMQKVNCIVMKQHDLVLSTEKREIFNALNLNCHMTIKTRHFLFLILLNITLFFFLSFSNINWFYLFVFFYHRFRFRSQIVSFSRFGCFLFFVFDFFLRLWFVAFVMQYHD